MMLEYGWQIFCLSMVLSVLFNYFFRFAAPQLALFDKPDGHRKLAHGTIPRSGGLAIFLALVVSSITLLFWSSTAYGKLSDNPKGFLIFSGCCAAITVLGFLDDRFTLKGRVKFLGQLITVGILVLGGGYSVSRISLFHLELDLGPLEIPFAFFWFLGAINAANLLDGMDGLLGSVAIVAAVGLGGIAFQHGQVLSCYLSMMLAGALLGFLYFNRPPASIYLGDAGSMLIGLFLAAISMKTTEVSTEKPWILAVPLAALLIPVIDTSAAILRRKLTGRSIYSTDHGHLHHCLQREGYGRSGALVIVIFLSVIAVVSSFIANHFKTDLFAWFGIMLVCLILVQSGWFGGPELRLVAKKTSQILRLSKNALSPRSAPEDGILLHGNKMWHQVWKRILDFAAKERYTIIQLDVNAPALHQAYHAQWSRTSKNKSGESDVLSMHRHPIRVGGRVVGRLSVVYPARSDMDGSEFQHLAKLVQLVEDSAREILDHSWEQVGSDKVSKVRGKSPDAPLAG